MVNMSLFLYVIIAVIGFLLCLVIFRLLLPQLIDYFLPPMDEEMKYRKKSETQK
ncbi:hypothetical protein [Algicola sagamiensis]|uniref:hypothetical protein n=1 Tax=Algicola sagamiensis TaxID=163869 RepID=UPI000369704A|nr:hypothetical protein [Algicola sagamiensis]